MDHGGREASGAPASGAGPAAGNDTLWQETQRCGERRRPWRRRLAVAGATHRLLRHSPYTAGITQLEIGDTLLVFSDGLTEAEGPGGAEIGSEPLLAIAREGLTLDARELSQSIGRRIEALTDGRPSADDRTLLVVKRCS